MKIKLLLLVFITLAIGLMETRTVSTSHDQQGSNSRLAQLVEANVIAGNAGRNDENRRRLPGT
ncbi:MAG TPA: hypothetical protein VF074_23870 [Pyrinomonadaceae bacterium]